MYQFLQSTFALISSRLNEESRSVSKQRNTNKSSFKNSELGMSKSFTRESLSKFKNEKTSHNILIEGRQRKRFIVQKPSEDKIKIRENIPQETSHFQLEDRNEFDTDREYNPLIDIINKPQDSQNKENNVFGETVEEPLKQIPTMTRFDNENNMPDFFMSEIKNDTNMSNNNFISKEGAQDVSPHTEFIESPEKKKTSLANWVDRRKSLNYESDTSQKDRRVKQRFDQVLYSIDNYSQLFQNI